MVKTSHPGKIAGALGLAVGVAAAAGYYFYGQGGKERRKDAAEWSKKAKAEILEKMQQMKEVTEVAYKKIVEEVLEKYKLVKNIDPVELQAFGKELKAHWEKIYKDAAKLGGKPPVKKVTKKV